MPVQVVTAEELRLGMHLQVALDILCGTPKVPVTPKVPCGGSLLSSLDSGYVLFRAEGSTLGVGIITCGIPFWPLYKSTFRNPPPKKKNNAKPYCDYEGPFCSVFGGVWG